MNIEKKNDEDIKLLKDKIKSLNKGLEKTRVRRNKYKRKYLKEKHKNKEYKNNMVKALNKINNMFDVGDGDKVIDDLLDLERILKGIE